MVLGSHATKSSASPADPDNRASETQTGLCSPATAPQPTYTTPQPTRGVTIVVDAGHGGDDPGTRGNGYSILPEKNNINTGRSCTG